MSSLGCPIEHISIILLRRIHQTLFKNHTKLCFPMYFGPWDVSGIVNRIYDINLALGISRNEHTNVGKLIFQQFSTISNKMFKMFTNKLTKGTIDQISIKTRKKTGRPVHHVTSQGRFCFSQKKRPFSKQAVRVVHCPAGGQHIKKKRFLLKYLRRPEADLYRGSGGRSP